MFTNNLVTFSFRYLTKILVGDQLQQWYFWSFHIAIQELASRSKLELGWSQAHLDSVWIESTWRWRSTKRLRFVQFKIQFRSIVKIRQCDMPKFTTHTCFKFHVYWFLVFGLTDLGFHEQIESTSLHDLMYIRFILYTSMLQLFIQTQFDNLFMYLGFVF